MVTILTHLDADGICSGSLIKMTKKYKNARVFFTHPAGLAKDLKGINDDLLICDIAIDIKSYHKTYALLEKISQEHEIYYFDHHHLPEALPEKVINIHNESISATEIVYRYFYHALPSYADHIALLGAICDYLDNSPLMKELLHHYERRTLFLDAGLLAEGLKKFSHGPNYDDLRKIVQRLSQGEYPCEIRELTRAALSSTRRDKLQRKNILENYEKRLNFAYIMDPDAGSRSKVAHWIMGHSGTLLGIVIIQLRSKPDMVDLTIRGRQLIDLRTIIPEIAQSIGGNAGGHSNAIGCRIPKNKLNRFLTILDEKLSQLHIPKPFRIAELIQFD
ncbi:hypothetical protein NEF87_002293 [Candidatus Lokiarchaeum ossiferum]|uniref:DHHA1 domain-containing protein n=1 Tax=Candidatus Lokiarchaeum ossiferum TaxID=2951803 RepID=A0ABY6HRN2_9ARCH|nr:hypothetical protein NEF87_002293 [Candidatus Lokiarchaeum sp. B-35]